MQFYLYSPKLFPWLPAGLRIASLSRSVLPIGRHAHVHVRQTDGILGSDKGKHRQADPQRLGRFLLGVPDDEERAAIPQVVCVMRYVDLRNASATFLQRLEAAAGKLRSSPVRMAAICPNGLFAWIETERDIDRVLVASDGKIHLNRPLGGVNSLDWGYEGCQAKLLRWYGERLVIVSFEKSTYTRTIEPISGDESGFFFEPLGA